MIWIQHLLKVLPWVIEGGRVVMKGISDKKINEIEKLKNEIELKDQAILYISRKTKIYFILFLISISINIFLIIMMYHN